MDDNSPSMDPTAGLCATCAHVEMIRTHRGSLFYLCRLSASDPRFPKYPRLPVLSCRAYERVSKAVPQPDSRGAETVSL